MKYRHHPKFLALASVLSVGALTGAVLAQDGTVSVTLNGNPLVLTPAPIERAGRVFVPLRGVFENLGATVVYQDGTINAQGHGRSVSLHVGSTQAMVNGQSEMLDVAPFIIGASTYVPLRFVSEALGASVNYDGNNRIVALAEGPDRGMHGQAPMQAPPPERRQQFDTVALVDVQPGDAMATRGSRPAISAHFSQPVDVNSLRITLDGRDVSSTTYLNAEQFDFTPPEDLPPAQHEVHVSGMSRDGVAFDRSFHFTSGQTARANFLSNLTPEAGATAEGNAFRVAGLTLPGSRVRIVASGGSTIEGFLRLGTDNFTTDVTADENGRFHADVPLQNGEAGNIVLSIQSTSPDGQSITRRESLAAR